MKALLILMLASITSMAQQTPNYQTVPNPKLHSWDVFMADPAAVGAANRIKGHCGDAHNEAAMNACFKSEFERADVELNEKFRRYLVRLDAKGHANLRDIERTWIVYRDLQCKTESARYEGGRLQPTEFFGCMAEQTNRRIRDMAEAYEQE